VTDSVEEAAEELPKWMLKALAAAQAKGIAALSADELRQQPAWPLLVDAAVVSSFLPRDLAPAAASGSGRNQAERLVLEHSQTTCTRTGAAAWQLNPDTRRAVLGRAIRDSELEPALQRTARHFDDPVSVAMRETLTKKAISVSEDVSLAALEARRTASTLLAGMGDLDLTPSIEKLDREIRNRRIVGEFRRMAGKDYEKRIVGRSLELEELRSYVGSIAAETAMQTVVRGIRNVKRALSGRRPYLIWGTGGVGKTTLISRFMLEHIEAARKNFPFAYLDFDRPSVSPRDPFGLLAEICLQVSTQFPELDRPLKTLRGEILDALPVESADVEAIGLLAPFAQKFRERIDEFLDRQESFFSWARPFLLVFDTFEVAQYDSNQVKHLERFAEILAGGATNGWPRLRLIISGRRKLTDFLGPVEGGELEGIDLEGARTLILRLASEANKPITADAAGEIAKLLATRKRNGAPSVHPLRLHMVGHLFDASSETNGKHVAAALLTELRAGLSREGAGKLMIDGILVRRIIQHVHSEAVQHLADPGLVVRRITPDVIRFVMARSSPPPRVQIEPDSLEFTPWEVSAEEADRIFDEFSRELTLVEPDGNALRHRQDVRMEMLPLIRASRPRRFLRIHAVAYEYLSSYEKIDAEIAAEAIYHGLWSHQRLEDIDRLWTKHGVHNPRIDPEEFTVDSAQFVYLKARNKERLTADEIRLLPGSIAARWIEDFSEGFLISAYPARELELIRAASGGDFSGLWDRPRAAAIAARLLHRTGEWRDAHVLLERCSIPQLPQNERTTLSRLQQSLIARSGAKISSLATLTMQGFETSYFEDPVASVESFCHTLIAWARARLLNRNIDPLHATLLEAVRRVPEQHWLSNRRILTLAIISLRDPPPELLASWIRQTDRLPREPEVAPLLRGMNLNREVAKVIDAHALRRLDPRITANRSLYDDLDNIWLEHRPQIAEHLEKEYSLRAGVRLMAAFDHGEWHRVLKHSLLRGLGDGMNLRDALQSLGAWPKSQKFLEDDFMGMVVAEGRFLDLARLLADETKARTDSAGASKLEKELGADAYPQTVHGIAVALVGWHETLLKLAQLKPNLGRGTSDHA
jgi:AAA ATPase domain